MRRTIVRRLTEAKATIPHFYLNADCDGPFGLNPSPVQVPPG